MLPQHEPSDPFYPPPPSPLSIWANVSRRKYMQSHPLTRILHNWLKKNAEPTNFFCPSSEINEFQQVQIGRNTEARISKTDSYPVVKAHTI